MSKAKKRTSIALHEDTKDRLAEHGSKGDTFEEILNDVLDQVEGQ